MPATHTHPLLSGLTPEQRLAVETTEGAVLVLAGPGSGKTRVITRRIAYLLSLGVPPWQVLAVTFTNKAAGEMKQRVEAILSEGSGEAPTTPRGLTITTFHALCARLLRRYAPLMEGRPRWGVKADYTIYDADDQLALMKKVIGELNLSTTNWAPRSVLGQISAAKNQLLDAEEFGRTAADFHSRTIAKLYDAYERALRAANAVDFDDLLMLSVRMLRECDEARHEVQSRWKYLMIDEYQDTNHAQFLLGTLVVGESGAPAADARSIEGIPGIDEDEPAPMPEPKPASKRNVFVVGDPDQSIYGWRGADIANILDFEEQYPGAKVIALGQNFRSTAPILSAADALIRHNKRRKHKPLFTSRQGGTPPQVVLCRDEHHEAQLVLDWIRARKDASPSEGAPGAHESGPVAWKDFAVFYRNNALSRVMEDVLRQAGVPYIIARGTAFYQREEVKDGVAYLRLLANPADEISLRRIVNKPARKIGGASLEKAADHAARTGQTLFSTLSRASVIPDLTPAATGAMRAFTSMVEGWSGGGSFLGEEVPSSLAELVSRVLSESGLEAHYRAAAQKAGEEEAEKLANLEELVNSARDFEQSYDPASDAANEAPRTDASTPAPPLLAMLRAYLERVSLVADADAIDPASGAVTLMTLHAAKGLEFRSVAMIGLEEGLLPSARALESEPTGEPEEERRLCFVGITRAMESLLITSAKYRSVRGLRERTIPSRFLSELPKDAVAFSDQSESWEEFTYDDDMPSTGRRSSSAAEGMPRQLGPAKPARAPRAEAAGSNDLQFPVGSRVRHPQFGLGKVQSVTGLGVNRRATIEFSQVGIKTLVLQYARLDRV